jgi:O-antigen ligase
MEIVFGLVFVILALSTFVNPFLGLLGLLVINLIRPGEIYPLFAMFRVERFFAILVLLSFFLNNYKLVFPPITKRLLLFYGAILLGVPFAVWRMGAFQGGIEFGKVVFYHLLIVALVTTRQRLRHFLIVLTCLVGFLALSSFILYATSSGGDPNTLGITLVSMLPFAGLLLLSRGMGFWRWIGLVVAGASVCTVVITGSRTAFFSMMFLFFIFALTTKFRVVVLPAAVLMLGLIWFVTPEQYKNRYLSVQRLDTDASYQARVHSRKIGWQMFLHNPVTGVGIRQFGNASGMQYSKEAGLARRSWLNAHNLYIQLLAELGLVGTICWLAFAGTTFLQNLRLIKILKADDTVPPWMRFYPTAANLSMLCLFLAGFAAHSLYRTSWYMCGALTAALTIMIAKESSDSAKSTDDSSESLSSDSELQPALGTEAD